MHGLLDLIWQPSRRKPRETAPPRGQAEAVVRGATYALQVRINDGWVNNMQDGEFDAQLRAEALDDGVDPGAPLAAFTIVETQDGDDLLLALGLTDEVTLDLPDKWVWELEHSDGGVVTSLLFGAGRTLDDVTRV